MINLTLSVTLLSVSRLLPHIGCRWWPLSWSWREVVMKRNTSERRHKTGWKTGRRLWRLEKDMSFYSNCDVAAAVCWKCISANSCAIRRERGTLLMGCHDETRERVRQWEPQREREEELRKQVRERRRYKRWRKQETEMEPSSRPFTAIITL